MAKAKGKTISIKFDAQTSRLLAGISGVRKSLNRLQREQQGFHQRMTSWWRSIGSAATAFNHTLQATRTIYRALTGPMREWIREGEAQRQVTQALSRDLASHGHVWSDVGAEVEAYAYRVQAATGIADDETQRLMSTVARSHQGLSLGMADVVRITDLTRDVSVAAEQSGDAVARALARAAAGNTRALRQMLPGMDQHIQAARSTEEIYALLEERMGGAAEAVDSLSLGLDRSRAALGNIRVGLGQIVIAGAQSSGVFTHMAERLEWFRDQLADGESQIGRFVRDGLGDLVAGARMAVTAVVRIGQAMMALVEAAKQSWYALNQWYTGMRARSGLAVEMHQAADQSATEWQHRMADLRGEIRRVSEAQGEYVMYGRRVVVTAEQQQARIAILNEELRQAEAGYESALAAMEQMADQAADNVDQYNRFGDAASSSWDRFKNSIEATELTREAFTEGLRRLEDGVREGTVSIEDMRARTTGLGEALGDAAREAERLVAAVDKLPVMLDDKQMDIFKRQVEATWKHEGRKDADPKAAAVGGSHDVSPLYKTMREDLGETMRGMLVDDLQDTLAMSASAIGQWVSGVEGAFGRLGETIRQSLAGTIGDIGRTMASQALRLAMTSGITGPLGLLIGIGTVMSGIAGALGGGRTAPTARDMGGVSQALDVIPGLIGERQAGRQGTVHYHMHTGAVFADPSRDDYAARAVAAGFGRAHALGELPVMP